MGRNFTERSDIESGFAAVYARDIAPKIKALKQDRSGFRRRTRRDIIIIAGLSLVVAAVLVVYDDSPILPALAFAGALALMAGLFLILRRNDAWSRALSTTVMPPICAFLGDLSYEYDGPSNRFLDPFQTLGILPKAGGRTLKHHISGTYRGTGFEMAEAVIQDSTGSNRTTVFTGLVFKIEVPVHVPTPVKILPRRRGPLTRIYEGLTGQGPGTPVDTGDETFDELFAVYCDDPDGARSLLTATVRQAFIAIEEGENASQFQTLTAAFDGHTFYLTMERREVAFAIGSYKVERTARFMGAGWLFSSDQDLERRIHALFRDVTIVNRIIDRLHGDKQPPSR